MRAASTSGTNGNRAGLGRRGQMANEESDMPVLLLWAVPAVIFVGGVGYFLVRGVH